MGKHNKSAKAPETSVETLEETVNPTSLKEEDIGIFVAATNISTGDKVYKEGEELNPDDFHNFARLLEIGAVRVESPKEKKNRHP